MNECKNAAQYCVLGFLNLAKSQKLRHLPITMTDDDLVAKYAAEGSKIDR